MEQSFLDFLVSKKLIGEDLAGRIIRFANDNNVGIVASIVEVSDLSETKIARNVSQYYSIPRFVYDHFDIDQSATELVSGIVSVRLGILPYKFGPNGELFVVCSDPDIVSGVIGEIKRLITNPINLEVGPLTAVRELAAFVHYGRSFADDLGDRLISYDRDDTNLEVSALNHPKTTPPPPPPVRRGMSQSRVSTINPQSQPSRNIASLSQDSDFDRNHNDFSGSRERQDLNQQLVNLVQLNENSEAFWESSDTLLETRVLPDDALRHRFVRKVTARVDQNEGRQQRSFASSPQKTPDFVGKDQAREHSTVVRSREEFQKYLAENKTPIRPVGSSDDESEMAAEILRQATTLESLNSQVYHLKHEVEELKALVTNLQKLIRDTGILFPEDEL